MNQLGKLGEQVARQFLETKGYQFVEANYSLSYGEVDLIMKDRGQYVFVEVKTRRENNAVAPNTELSAQKRDRLQKTASTYAGHHEIEDWRLELVAVTILSSGMAKATIIPL